MRKQKTENNTRLKELWLELIITIMLFIAIVLIVVISSIYIKKMDAQFESSSSMYYSQNIDYGG